MRSLSETLTTTTGFNVTGLYDRVQANEEFDRRTDVVDGFTRVTDGNFDEVVVYERFDLADDGATEDDRVWFLFVLVLSPSPRSSPEQPSNFPPEIATDRRKTPPPSCSGTRSTMHPSSHRNPEKKSQA